MMMVVVAVVLNFVVRTISVTAYICTDTTRKQLGEAMKVLQRADLLLPPLYFKTAKVPTDFRELCSPINSVPLTTHECVWINQKPV